MPVLMGNSSSMLGCFRIGLCDLGWLDVRELSMTLWELSSKALWLSCILLDCSLLLWDLYHYALL